MGAISEAPTLRAGALEVGLAAAIGGSVGAMRWRGVDLMRRLSDDDRDAGNVLGVAMFPMVPYAYRIVPGRSLESARRSRYEWPRAG